MDVKSCISQTGSETLMGQIKVLIVFADICWCVWVMHSCMCVCVLNHMTWVLPGYCCRLCREWHIKADAQLAVLCEFVLLKFEFKSGETVFAGFGDSQC